MECNLIDDVVRWFFFWHRSYIAEDAYGSAAYDDLPSAAYDVYGNVCQEICVFPVTFLLLFIIFAYLFVLLYWWFFPSSRHSMDVSM
jgi:hypothetical protein